MKNAETVMLVDDNTHEHMFFELALKNLKGKYRLLKALDCDECLALLHKQNPLPDVIFMDINMPKRNGFECLSEALKQDDRFKHIPVVIYSTSQQDRDVVAAKEAGAAWFLSKSTVAALTGVLAYVLGETTELPEEVMMRKF